MDRFQIYTSGATKNVLPCVSYEWRKAAQEYLEKCETDYDVHVFVPDEHFNYESLKPQTEKQCMNYFLWQLDNSKLMLLNLDNSSGSCGTSFEVMRAIDKGIPIIGFGNENVYPWTKECCSVIFENEMKALRYIRDYYLNV